MIPIHDAEGKTAALRNVLRRTNGIHVVLVFDSCRDNTFKEFEEILKNREILDVEVIIGDFGSPGAARNAGLAKVQSDWVVFWDADDLPDPSALTKVIEKVDSNLFQMIVTQFNSVDFSTNVLCSTASRTRGRLSLAINPGLWRITFNTDRAKKLAFQEFKMGEDQFFLAEFMATKPRILFSPIQTYLYSLNTPGQLTGSIKTKLELRQSIKALMRLIIKNRTNLSFLGVMVFRQSSSLVKTAFQVIGLPMPPHK